MHIWCRFLITYCHLYFFDFCAQLWKLCEFIFFFPKSKRLQNMLWKYCERDGYPCLRHRAWGAYFTCLVLGAIVLGWHKVQVAVCGGTTSSLACSSYAKLQCLLVTRENGPAQMELGASHKKNFVTGNLIVWISVTSLLSIVTTVQWRRAYIGAWDLSVSVWTRSLFVMDDQIVLMAVMKRRVGNVQLLKKKWLKLQAVVTRSLIAVMEATSSLVSAIELAIAFGLAKRGNGFVMIKDIVF